MEVISAFDLQNGKTTKQSSMGSYLSQPLQFLPRAEKTDEWYAGCCDFFEWQGIKQLGNNARRLMKNYKHAKGVIDKSDYIVEEDNEMVDLVQTLATENIAALELKFYPIIPNIVNVLCNEFSKKNSEISFHGKGEFEYNDLLEKKGKQIEQVLLSQAQQKVISAMIESGADPEDPEIKQQLEQQLSPENLKTLPEIEEFFSKTYRSLSEQWASHQHQIDIDRFHMDELEERGFRDMLITDREFWHFKMMENDYDIELWNPPLVFYHKSPEVRYISQGNWVGKIDLMTTADVIDKYGWIMTEDQQLSLEQIYPVQGATYAIQGLTNQGDYYDSSKSHQWNVSPPSLAYRQYMSAMDMSMSGRDVVSNILDQSENTFNDNIYNLARVTTMYWKTQQKYGHLTKIAESGEVTVDIIDEDYKVTDKPLYNTILFKNKTRDNLIFGEHIDWIWINQVCGAVKIGPNRPSFLGMANSGTGVNPMYLGIMQNKPGPIKFQFKGDSTMYGAKLPVEGCIFSDRNTKSVSLVDSLKPAQIGFNIVNNQISDILVDEIGTVIVLDQNTLPKHSLGEDWGKNSYANSFVAMKNFQMLPLDTSMKNTETPLNFSNFQSINLEQTNRLLSRIQLANYFKQQAYEVVGVTPQRLGQQLGQTESARGVEQAVVGSFAQTEHFFTQHSDNLMPRVHQMRTDLAQFYQSRNPSVRLQYLTSMDEKVNFEINGTDLLMADINIYATTKANYREMLEQLKKMAVENNTTGASIFDLGGIIQSRSMAEIDHAMKGIEKKANAKFQQEQENVQRIKQMELESIAKEKQLDRDDAAREAEKRDRKDILVAEIRAASLTGMQDKNENNQNDYLDFLDRIEGTSNFQDTINLQREKENNRMSGERLKMLTEEKKIASQERIKQIDLEIARENKTNMEIQNKGKAQQKAKDKKTK